MPRVAGKVYRKKRLVKPKYGRIRGRGAYSMSDVRNMVKKYVQPYTKGILAKAGRSAGKFIGSAYAPALSAPLSNAGEQFGEWLGKISGLGAYKLQRNSLVSSSQVPFMHSSQDGVRIRHREFIQDISSSIAFSSTSIAMNPGMSETFPWLSAIAQNFEEYRFEGLAVEFKSTSADALNSTNTALGTIIMAAEYNSSQSAYINKQQMENSMWAMSAKPSECMIMPVECAPSLNPLSNQYIRLGDVASGQDIRLYDLCNVQIASVGSQAAAVVGELWVTYDVVLFKPQLDSGLALSAQSAHYQLTAPVVTTAYFGTARTESFDSIGLSFTGTVLTFPIGSQGRYQITYRVVGDSTALTAPTFTYANASEQKIWDANTVYGASNTGSTAVSFNRSTIIYIPDPTVIATLTLSVGTLPANPTAGDLFVNQLNNDID